MSFYIFEPIPDAELLAMASEFNLGPLPIVNGRLDWLERFPRDVRHHSVRVSNMGNPDDDGPDRWGIFQSGRRDVCLSKSGAWVFQSMPSSRSKNFYSQCRFDSPHEAIIYYRKWHEAVIAWIKKAIAKKKGRGENKDILELHDVPTRVVSFKTLMKDCSL
jgi:hypothetical protein